MSRLVSAAEMAARREQSFDELEARLEREQFTTSLEVFRELRAKARQIEADPSATNDDRRRARQSVARAFGQLACELADKLEAAAK